MMKRNVLQTETGNSTVCGPLIEEDLFGSELRTTAKWGNSQPKGLLQYMKEYIC